MLMYQTVDSLSAAFYEALNQGTTAFILHKQAFFALIIPMITPMTCNLMRRKRLYSRQRQRPSNSNIAKYKEDKRMLKASMKQFYWEHITNVLTYNAKCSNHDRNKRFWTDLKHCKRDSISPLMDQNWCIAHWSPKYCRNSESPVYMCSRLPPLHPYSVLYTCAQPGLLEFIKTYLWVCCSAMEPLHYPKRCSIEAVQHRAACWTINCSHITSTQAKCYQSWSVDLQSMAEKGRLCLL